MSLRRRVLTAAAVAVMTVGATVGLRSADASERPAITGPVALVGAAGQPTGPRRDGVFLPEALPRDRGLLSRQAAWVEWVRVLRRDRTWRVQLSGLLERAHGWRAVWAFSQPCISLGPPGPPTCRFWTFLDARDGTEIETIVVDQGPPVNPWRP